jgi:hypothetical protein
MTSSPTDADGEPGAPLRPARQASSRDGAHILVSDVTTPAQFSEELHRANMQRTVDGIERLAESS